MASTSTTYKNHNASRFEFDQYGVNKNYNTVRQEKEELRLVQQTMLMFTKEYFEKKLEEKVIKADIKEICKRYKEQGFDAAAMKASANRVIKEAKKTPEERERDEILDSWVRADSGIMKLVHEINEVDDQFKEEFEAGFAERQEQFKGYMKDFYEERREINTANGMQWIDFERERVAKLAHADESFTEQLAEIDADIKIRDERRAQGLPPLKRHLEPVYPDEYVQKYKDDEEERKAREKLAEKRLMARWEGFELPENFEEVEAMTNEEFKYFKEYIETKFKYDMHKGQPYLGWIRKDHLRRAALRSWKYYQCIQDDIIWKAWCDRYDNEVGHGIADTSPEEFKRRFPEPKRNMATSWIDWDNDFHVIESNEEYLEFKNARLNGELWIDQFGSTVEGKKPEGWVNPGKVIVFDETVKKAKELVYREWYESLEGGYESRWEQDLEALLAEFDVVTEEEARKNGWFCPHEPINGRYNKEMVSTIGCTELYHYTAQLEKSLTRNIPEENIEKSELFILGNPVTASLRFDEGENWNSWSSIYDGTNGEFGYPGYSKGITKEKLLELGNPSESFKEIQEIMDNADSKDSKESLESKDLEEGWEILNESISEKSLNSKESPDLGIPSEPEKSFKTLEDADAWLDSLIKGEI